MFTNRKVDLLADHPLKALRLLERSSHLKGLQSSSLRCMQRLRFSGVLAHLKGSGGARGSFHMAAFQQTLSWDGTGTQQDLMLKDQCILVNEEDHVVGHANKWDSHRFVPTQERGLLHRAFSVFLFSPDNKLLLQQRAHSKITFPGVWTNTCCSHPLYGFDPPELDSNQAIADGSVPGAKWAAIRKLQHELGILPEEVPLRDFRFLTRLHYCAADEHTYGPQAEWGEHEIDYILFIRAPVSLKPHPDEVAAVKYVDRTELRKMMDPASGLRWSPWFRIIAENFLEEWWRDLDRTLMSDDFVDTQRIHRILG